ncbi:uncharacterized protein LOC124157837 [Ischnura elegans]|uniref:uncharacterized protein LOC124157837 n=1 Tax=Ischnura elegans TaxID=197161 RepID=UPI001ED8869E|nr:uncharacterized protein LOC124157837 [Ischnura elegans]
MFSDSSDDSDEMSSACKWWLIGTSSNREFSAHPINQVRQDLGEYHHLFSQIKEYPDKFQEYMRMSPETFSYICANESPKLDNCRKYCNLHINPICSEEQIVVTIRYLATGSSYKTLGFSFRMGDNTVGKIVRNVCKLL